MSVESVATMLMIVPEANEVVDQGQEGGLLCYTVLLDVYNFTK